MSYRARATEPWTRSYDDALAVARGQRVRVQQEDDEWPGWFWCLDDHGTGGWLPGGCLEKTSGEALVVQDFDTVELTVARGATLECLQSREGWVWCRDATGQEGWVPGRVLTRV